LGASEKKTNKKLLVFDTGVYLTECGLDTGELLAAEIFDELNKGNVVEMQTGLEIIKYSSPYAEATVCYWYRSGANAEIDYAIAKNNAMTSRRSYRDILPQAIVRAEIERCKGTQFDPVIADYMLEMMDEDTDYQMHE
jgi:hypothetical protein